MIIQKTTWGHTKKNNFPYSTRVTEDEGLFLGENDEVGKNTAVYLPCLKPLLKWIPKLITCNL